MFDLFYYFFCGKSYEGGGRWREWGGLIDLLVLIRNIKVLGEYRLLIKG